MNEESNNAKGIAFTKENEFKDNQQDYLAMLKVCQENLKLSDEFIADAENCSSWLEFLFTEDLEHRKLHRAVRCHHRFCPICQMLESRKLAFELLKVMLYITVALKHRAVFVTLTVPNVKGEDLKDTIKRISQKYGKMVNSRPMRDRKILGSYRYLEVTYNAEANTYHPHLHCVWIVDETYFNDTQKYISHEALLSMWQEYYGDDSISQVNIKAMKTGLKDIFELTKYVAKSSDYLHSSEVFETYYTALKGSNKYSTTKLFKDVHRMVKKGIITLMQDKKEYEYVYKAHAQWSKENGYQITELKPWSDSKKKDNEVIDMHWETDGYGLLVKLKAKVKVSTDTERTTFETHMGSRKYGMKEKYAYAKKREDDYVKQCFKMGLKQVPYDVKQSDDDFIEVDGIKLLRNDYYVRNGGFTDSEFERKFQRDTKQYRQLGGESDSVFFEITKTPKGFSSIITDDERLLIEKLPLCTVVLKYDYEGIGIPEEICRFDVVRGVSIKLEQLAVNGKPIGNWKIKSGRRMVSCNDEIRVDKPIVVIGYNLKGKKGKAALERAIRLNVKEV